MDKWVACGLEVSARELMVAVEGEERVRRFANTVEGHGQLVKALTRGGRRVRVVMEATGLYGWDVALLLSETAGVEVMVANPRAMRDFAKSLLQRSKSDLRDVRMLREYAARMPFQKWQRPNENRLALWAIARRLQALTEMCRAEKNRRHAAGLSRATPVCVRRDITRNLQAQQRAMHQLRQQARQYIAAEVALHREYQLLLTVRGIAEISAIQILGELAVLPKDRDVRQWVAYAGLDPVEYSSGASMCKPARISKAGNRHLRQALYMPALTAIRWEPHLRGFYQHLVLRGKKKKQALLAVARKLLHAIYGMFRTSSPYDGSRVFLLPIPAHTPAPPLAGACTSSEFAITQNFSCP
jgi:transposase